MFIAFVQYNQTVTAILNASSVANVMHDSVEKAKAALSDYITRNKSSFQNGYTAYVIDQSTQKVVSYATVPQPSLEWQTPK